MGAGLVMTGHAVLTPLLQAISILANDFVTTSRAADRAPSSPYPDAWHVPNLVLAAVPLGLTKLAHSLAILAVAWYALLLLTTAVFALGMDFIKLAVFRHLRLD